jgi:drug/metabolite transporter (DMT)-like permease
LTLACERSIVRRFEQQENSFLAKFDSHRQTILKGYLALLPENNHQNNELSFGVIVYAIFLCALFGANTVAIKYSFSGLGAFTTAAIRFSVATLILFCWAKLTRKSLVVKKEQWHHIAVLSVGFFIQISLFNLGLNKSQASRAILLINLLPFLVLFLAHYFIADDRITVRKLVGLFFGFMGVAFVFLEKSGLTSEVQAGDMIILTGTLIWACDTVYRKRILLDFDPLHLVFYPIAFSTPFFFIEALIWDKPMFLYLDYRILISFIYQSLVTASFGFLAWNYLLQKHGAVSLSSFTFIMPIIGIILSHLILSEPITPKIIFSLLFITSGIFILHFKLKRPALLFPPRAEM